jgi:hypothetical protein
MHRFRARRRDLAFYSTWCPFGTSIETLVTIEGHRWAIEDSFETAKNELGLDHNETRSWHGWHRHVSLVMLAFAMMAAIRHQANTTTPKKTNAGFKNRPALDPLVGSGNSAYRHSSRAKTHQALPHHRMVDLATRPSGRSSQSSRQTESATVMLVFSGEPDTTTMVRFSEPR